jgi:alpha-galactosidase
MSITICNNYFHIKSKSTSYIIKLENNLLLHVYWGKIINNGDLDYFNIRDVIHWSNEVDILPQELPMFGTGDYRSPMLELEFDNGSRVADFRYYSHKIYTGKPALEGLPATYCENDEEASTLEIELYDCMTNTYCTMLYTVFTDYNVITRNIIIKNNGQLKLKIDKALSTSIDFMDNDFELVYLHGAWARECHIEKRKVNHGMHTISSVRGASSHNKNPFLAIARPHTTEHIGEVYALNLVYSGNFEINAEVSSFDMLRIQAGINHKDFCWILEPGESFVTPECILAYSDQGFNGISKTLHKHYRERLCRGNFKNKERPLLMNNWEATYFDFNEQKIIEIAECAKQLGIELFVLDDGWFGERNSDNCSLGDWYVNKQKFPNGLQNLVKHINNLGMAFGIWFEPEMVSPNSELYKKHPDWCLHIDERKKTEVRNQLVLDLSRKDVCDYIINTISDILASANISYVKWDMNRSMTEVYSKTQDSCKQKETAHRYILGLYYTLEAITKKFPNILFESCSGGGGRFDPGMLYYMPQTWTSDDTDAVERLYIQYGTSMVYPIVTMGAHVSSVPNHQTGRITSLKMRGDVAISGNLGYELDPTKLSFNEFEECKKQIEFYKENRRTIQFGEFDRLISPFDGNYAAWQFVSEDKNEVIVCIYKVLSTPASLQKRFKITNLEENALYQLDENDLKITGSQLMNVGLVFDEINSDFQSKIFKFRKISTNLIM